MTEPVVQTPVEVQTGAEQRAELIARLELAQAAIAIEHARWQTVLAYAKALEDCFGNALAALCANDQAERERCMAALRESMAIAPAMREEAEKVQGIEPMRAVRAPEPAAGPTLN